MKLNRLLSLFLSAFMILSLLTACGGSQQGSGSSAGSAGSAGSGTSNTGSSSSPAALKMNKIDISLYKFAETFQLSVSGVPEGAAVEWKVDNDQIASVTQDGLVTAVAPGIARVYAYAGDQSVECIVRCKFEVYPDDKPSGSGSSSSQPGQPDAEAFQLNKSDFTLFKTGESYQLKPSGLADPSATLLWASSDESVATVSADGTVTAVGAGTATISVSVATDPSLTATCIVRCKLGDNTSGGSGNQPSASVDLTAFYNTLFSDPTNSPAMTELTGEMLDGCYPGLSAINTNQCLVYMPQISAVAAEIALIEVADSADVAAVKDILQARVDSQVAGGAWYPATTAVWENNSRIVSNGNYIMLIVYEQCDTIVADFNALF